MLSETPIREPSAQDPQLVSGCVRVDSKALLHGQRELLIVHNGREYRLRLTQNGKLILTA